MALRIGGEPVTFDLGAAWPSIFPAVIAMLAQLGVDAEAAADIAQETAYRAWLRRGQFGTERDCRRWCCQVARNLAIDDWRRARRLRCDGELPDVADPDGDPAVVARYRIGWQQAMAAVRVLAPRQQRAAMAAAMEEVAEGDAERQSRRTARRRLRLMVAEQPVGVPAAPGRWRRLLTWRPTRRTLRWLSVGTAVLAGGGLLGLGGVSGAVGGGRVERQVASVVGRARYRGSFPANAPARPTVAAVDHAAREATSGTKRALQSSGRYQWASTPADRWISVSGEKNSSEKPLVCAAVLSPGTRTCLQQLPYGAKSPVSVSPQGPSAWVPRLPGI